MKEKYNKCPALNSSRSRYRHPPRNACPWQREARPSIDETLHAPPTLSAERVGSRLDIVSPTISTTGDRVRCAGTLLVCPPPFPAGHVQFLPYTAHACHESIFHSGSWSVIGDLALWRFRITQHGARLKLSYHSMNVTQSIAIIGGNDLATTMHYRCRKINTYDTSVLSWRVLHADGHRGLRRQVGLKQNLPSGAVQKKQHAIVLFYIAWHINMSYRLSSWCYMYTHKKQEKLCCTIIWYLSCWSGLSLTVCESPRWSHWWSWSVVSPALGLSTPRMLHESIFG